jgi:Cu(I)/Ag(I) efflux system membrane fusion protein
VVLALGEGRFASRVVGLGRVGEHYIEILEGLAEHDEVVVSAQFLLDSESSKSADLKRMDSGDSATAFPTGESGAGHRHEMGGSHD